MGSYYFVYVSQVATETQNSIAIFVLWSMVLFFSFTTGLLIDGIGIVGTFGMFAAISLVGAFYFIKTMQSTQGLSSEECKKVYWPEEFKGQN